MDSVTGNETFAWYGVRDGASTPLEFKLISYYLE